VNLVEEDALAHFLGVEFLPGLFVPKSFHGSLVLSSIGLLFRGDVPLSRNVAHRGINGDLLVIIDILVLSATLLFPRRNIHLLLGRGGPLFSSIRTNREALLEGITQPTDLSAVHDVVLGEFSSIRHSHDRTKNDASNKKDHEVNRPF
jgi:hypothetical protein